MEIQRMRNNLRRVLTLFGSLCLGLAVFAGTASLGAKDESASIASAGDSSDVRLARGISSEDFLLTDSASVASSAASSSEAETTNDENLGRQRKAAPSAGQQDQDGTDPPALEDVDSWLVTGVVATVPTGSGRGSAGPARFRQAYEAHFQRSLVSTTPALGYDAAVLLLEALRPGRLRSEDVRDSFRSLVGIEGATGIFSIVDERVVRQTEVVRIDSAGQLIPIPIG